MNEGMHLLDASNTRQLGKELIEEVDDAASLLKAIANEKRIVILCRLLEGEKSVGEMEGLLDLSQSALSQHLARLRAVKIVKTRRVAQTIYYSLNGKSAESILLALHGLFVEPNGESGAKPQRSPMAM